MDTLKEKILLIEQIIQSNDPDAVSKIKAILSGEDMPEAYGSSEALEIHQLKEEKIALKSENKLEKEYTLSADQEKRVLLEIQQSEEDIKNGRIYTQDEVENYFAEKIASRKAS